MLNVKRSSGLISSFTLGKRKRDLLEEAARYKCTSVMGVNER